MQYTQQAPQPRQRKERALERALAHASRDRTGEAGVLVCQGGLEHRQPREIVLLRSRSLAVLPLGAAGGRTYTVLCRRVSAKAQWLARLMQDYWAVRDASTLYAHAMPTGLRLDRTAPGRTPNGVPVDRGARDLNQCRPGPGFYSRAMNTSPNRYHARPHPSLEHRGLNSCPGRPAPPLPPPRLDPDDEAKARRGRRDPARPP